MIFVITLIVCSFPIVQPIDFDVDVIPPFDFIDVVPKKRTTRKRGIPWKFQSLVIEQGQGKKRRKRVRPNNLVWKILVKFDK